jgi:diguanylate cyclase (GGDEF)-like protein/PAS domain S-box-containing protein
MILTNKKVEPEEYEINTPCKYFGVKIILIFSMTSILWIFSMQALGLVNTYTFLIYILVYTVLLYLLIYQDINYVVQAKEKLSVITTNLIDSKRAFYLVFNNSLVGVCLIENKKIIKANEKFLTLFKIKEEEISQFSCYNIFSSNKEYKDLCFICSNLPVDTTKTLVREIKLLSSDGSYFWAKVSSKALTKDPMLKIALIIQDITEFKESEDKLNRIAFKDPLTNLNNRVSFNLKIQKLITEEEVDKFGVLFLDLDYFKVINDTLGHTIGDKLLVKVGKRIQECLEHDDFFARLGGDEFVILITQPFSYGKCREICNCILKMVKRPFQIETHEVYIGTSIGVAIYPTDGTTKEELIKCADIAMYKAKELSRNNACFYDKSMNKKSEEHLFIETNLRQAMDRNELFIQYQPILDLETNTITCVEALVRWKSDKYGIIPPNSFIPIAENTGLILSIGEWVLDRVCKDLNNLLEYGLSVVMSVNLSPRQLQHTEIVKSIKQILNENKIDPKLIRLELTETSLMCQKDIINLLKSLRSLGVDLAIDDFGTGYSSLSYLKYLPVSTLKIDKSFIDGIPVDVDDTSLVKGIIGLGKNLGLKVIAEGIESQSQRTCLERCGCDSIQGYLISRPVDFEVLKNFLLKD